MILLFSVGIFLCSMLAFCQLAYPFYRRHTSATPLEPTSLTAWYQTQVQELTCQLQQQDISQDLYQQNLLVLQRELLLSQNPSALATATPSLPRYSWVLIALVGVALSLSFYGYQGSATTLIKHYQTLNNNQQATQFLKTIGGVDQLKNALQSRLQQNPNDAHGWYLLGRLYLHDNLWAEAIAAFTDANRLQPNNVDTELSLAEALYLHHQPQQTRQAQAILQSLLRRDPSNPGALNLLALLAYQEQHYQRAIDLWQALWNQMPADSDTAITLQKAMQRARDAMKDHPSQPG